MERGFLALIVLLEKAWNIFGQKLRIFENGVFLNISLFCSSFSAFLEFCGGECFVFKTGFRRLGVFTWFDKVLDDK